MGVLGPWRAGVGPNVPTWDRAASAYARQERWERRAVSRALDLAAVGPGERLLDVATGTGLVLRTLAGRPGRPAWAEGIDASPRMLAQVGDLPPGWITRLADAGDLPYADASFDAVIASYLLQVLDTDDRRAVLAEISRVLRPGGRLVTVTTWSARRVVGDVLGRLAARAPESLIGLTPHDPRPELAPAGLVLERALTTRPGYPSLVVRARRPQGPDELPASRP